MHDAINRFGLFLIGFIFFSPFASATEIVENFQSVRGLGMGGVYTFDRVDAGVLFKNPAGLDRVQGLNLSIFDLGFGVGGGASFLSTIDSFKAIGNLNGISSLNSVYGKPVWAGAGGYTAIALPHFGAAVFDTASITLRVDNPAYTNLNANYFNDYGFQTGGSFSVGMMSFGLAAKRVTRTGGSKNVGGATLANVTNNTLSSQFQDAGYGFGMDGGVLIAPPAPFNPIFSMAWQDMGFTSFIQTAGSSAPPRIHDNVTFSATFGGEVPLLGFRGGVEYRHITDTSEVLGKKLHVGAEITVAMFDLRAGLYQGYPTYGVGLDLFFLQVDAAYYKIEKGAYPGQTPDERVQVSLAMNLDFDLSFNLSDSSSGKRRKLKQRR